MPPLVFSLLAIPTLIACAVLLSSQRRAIRLRTVASALGCQLIIGGFVYAVPWGRELLQSLTFQVSNLINAGKTGIEFLFGNLATGNQPMGFIFAFQVLPVIIFFSSLISLLYHLGIMGWVIRLIGGALQRLLGTSRAESLSAAANIFVGQTEAPLVVRPYIKSMTRSELFAVMVGGLATVAGSVLAGYVGLGAELKYLLAASFMAAPGALLYAKLLEPETQQPVNQILPFASGDEAPANFLDAAALGAASGLKLALNVGAMLLAFIGLIAVMNLVIGGVGGWFGHPELSLQQLLGLAFAPVAALIGVPWPDIQAGGSLIGQKLILNEFIAFADFKTLVDTLQPRSRAILSVALCGFANLSSIAILLGGLGGMAPSRRSDIARLGLKAVLAATLANLTSAAITGLFFQSPL